MACFSAVDFGISGLPVIVDSRSGRCKVALFFRDFFHPFREELWSYNHDDGIHLHTVRTSSRPCVFSLVLSRLQCLASFCVLSCVVCRCIPCICSCSGIHLLLQLRRSVGPRLGNGLTSSTLLDSSIVIDKMGAFSLEEVCSRTPVSYHKWLLVGQSHLA